MKSFWRAETCLVILAIACCAATTEAQRRPVSSAKTVEGVLYAVGGGQHIITFLLHTADGTLSFTATDKTRYVNFGDEDTAWKIGARWRVAYRGAPGGEADAVGITFTGQIDGAVSGAAEAGWQFLDALSERDYRQAYERLSPALKQRLSFDAFTRTYQNTEVDRRAVVICSQAEDKVELLLAPSGSDVSPYQPAEVARVGGKWLLDQLDPFTERPAGCETP